MGQPGTGGLCPGLPLSAGYRRGSGPTSQLDTYVIQGKLQGYGDTLSEPVTRYGDRAPVCFPTTARVIANPRPVPPIRRLRDWSVR